MNKYLSVILLAFFAQVSVSTGRWFTDCSAEKNLLDFQLGDCNDTNCTVLPRQNIHLRLNYTADDVVVAARPNLCYFIDSEADIWMCNTLGKSIKCPSKTPTDCPLTIERDYVFQTTVILPNIGTGTEALARIQMARLGGGHWSKSNAVHWRSGPKCSCSHRMQYVLVETQM
ncbi:hypothetical protein EG68_05938 [Paragonimus skrjabini miyazakii]|uniref:MD-2-related lipid-recognition domain-containing protein n=1 Tax=Paragonimus skrjabini miyazakii TaxID=59628 RepID=A0A8S9YNZ1_9TREM|nr:hypothetical protein EG68_05938 [Paragonimus skrjabini miyazakii]